MFKTLKEKKNSTGTGTGTLLNKECHCGCFWNFGYFPNPDNVASSGSGADLGSVKMDRMDQGSTNHRL
jgi:hypothetical protein